MEYFGEFDRFADYGLFDDPGFAESIGIFLAIAALFFIGIAAVNLVFYILRSLGLYKIAANRGMDGAGLAWIPIVGVYRIGSIADDIAEKNGTKSHFGPILLFGMIGSWLISTISSGIIFATLIKNFDYYDFGYGGDFGGMPGFSNTDFFSFGLSRIGSLAGCAVYVVLLIALNKIFKLYRPASSTAWTVLSVIFPFMQPIFLFMIRDSSPVQQWNAPAQEWNAQAGYYNPQLEAKQEWQPAPPTHNQYQQPPLNGGYYAPPPPPPPPAPPTPPQAPPLYQPPQYSQQYRQPSQYQPPQYSQQYQQPQYQPPQYAPQPQVMHPAPPEQPIGYQPPFAPNPPEAWEIEDSAHDAPPVAPWENDNPENGR